MKTKNPKSSVKKAIFVDRKTNSKQKTNVKHATKGKSKIDFKSKTDFKFKTSTGKNKVVVDKVASKFDKKIVAKGFVKRTDDKLEQTTTNNNEKVNVVKAYTINIDENYYQQRIDNFLLRELKSVPKSHVYRLLRKGEVRVNGKRIQAEYKLEIGDVVRVPPVRQAQSIQIKLQPKTQAMLTERIIYEDDAIIVFNKPSGMASHGGSGLSYGVIEAMRQLRPNLKTLELVHRLDKDTSGCMLLAKKRSALRQLHSAWRNNEVGKTYVLLVKGKVKAQSYAVNVGLEKNRLVSGERFVKVSNNKYAKETLTEFTPIKIFAKTSLLQAKLYTGKTHQIRVHAQHTGNPIAGDVKYGDVDFNDFMAKLGLKRLFLHSSELKFKLPGSESVVTFNAPLDADLDEVLQKF